MNMNNVNFFENDDCLVPTFRLGLLPSTPASLFIKPCKKRNKGYKPESLFLICGITGILFLFELLTL